jgi:diguanylate cyclase (GGDEF)-like protein
MNISTFIDFPPEVSSEVERNHDAEIAQLLPLLGPLCGLAVLLYGVWDYLIDSSEFVYTLGIRSAMVLLGSTAYFPNSMQLTPWQRCRLFYATHAGAIIICVFLLHDGVLFGLPGITACVFATSILTVRIRTLLQILAGPSILFVILCVTLLPPLQLINCLMFYLFSVALAILTMFVNRSFRLHAYILEQRLLHQSQHDSLTGIYSRGYLTELAEREVAMAKRHGRALSIAMIDIDHFKEVNDTFGHDIGDKTLKALVEICETKLRVIDHFGRIGGEEFVCVLPETDEASAMQCAERLRQSIGAMEINFPGGKLQITVSIGVAVLKPYHENWDALLKDADTALYLAKRSGRNRVTLANTRYETSKN